MSFSFSGEMCRVVHQAAALEPSEDAVRRTDRSTEAVSTSEEHHRGHMKVVPLSEAREGSGCEKSVFVSDVNNRTLPSEQDLAEAAHQPLNVRLQSDLDSASTERALPQDSSIIRAHKQAPVSHAQNSCGSVAHAHNSCGSVAHAHNSCNSEALAQNSCNPTTVHARDSCSSKARTPERHLSASSCSSSSSIFGRGRQEPVPTRPASFSEVMSGMDTNLSPRPNWDPPTLSPASVCVPARNQRGDTLACG